MASDGAIATSILVVAVGTAAWWLLEGRYAYAGGFHASGTSGVPSRNQSAVATSGKADASVWLSHNRNSHALNGFRSTKDALAYVIDAQILGAQKIIVDGIHDQPNEPGPSADTLYLTLPADKQRRMKLLNFIVTTNLPDELNRTQGRGGPRIVGPDESRQPGTITFNDLKGGDRLRLWWD
jgi:hypothetical protein